MGWSLYATRGEVGAPVQPQVDLPIHPSQSVVDSSRHPRSSPPLRVDARYSTAALLAAHSLTRIEEGLGSNVIDAGREFRAYMVDMYLLAEGAVFLGSFMSNAARLAYSLMSAGTEGCLRPYQSADINWCYAFFKEAPTSSGATACLPNDVVGSMGC